jgi:hypothetical protein
MESMNIGTEATYASIVSKIVDRKYIKISSSDGSPVTLTDMTLDPLTGVIDTTQREILHGSYKNRLVSTELGKKVTDLLESNVSAIMKYDYTSNLERQIIQVEQGDKSWQDVVLNCFQTLHPGINAWSKSHSAGLNKRVLNTDSYGPVSVYEGKYSPVIQWSVRTQKKTGKHTRTTNVKQYTPLPQRYNWRDVPIDMIEKIINGYYRDQKRSLHSNLMYKGAGYTVVVKKGRKAYGPYLSLYNSNKTPIDLKHPLHNLSLKPWMKLHAPEFKDGSVLSIKRTVIQSILDEYGVTTGMSGTTTCSYYIFKDYKEYYVKVCPGKGKRPPYIQLTHRLEKKKKPLFIPITVPDDTTLDCVTQEMVSKRVIEFIDILGTKNNITIK